MRTTHANKNCRRWLPKRLLFNARVEIIFAIGYGAMLVKRDCYIIYNMQLINWFESLLERKKEK